MGTYWGWLLPVVLYVGAFVLVLIWRAKLPPAVENLGLDMVEKNEAPSTDSHPEVDAATDTDLVDEPAKNLEIHLEGKSGDRKVKLDLSDSGLHWRADATAFLHGSEELRVPWDELQSVHIHHGSLFFTWSAMFAAILYTFVWNPQIALAATGLAAILYFIEKKRAVGTFRFVTATHDLTLRSRQIDRGLHARLAQAVRAKNSAAAPRSDDNDDNLHLLVTGPLVQFKDAFSSDASIQEKIVPLSGPSMDEAAKTRGTLQWRMFGLYFGTIVGAGPLSVGLAVALAANHSFGFVAGWFVAWFVGLVLVTKLLRPMARFIGAQVKE